MGPVLSRFEKGHGQGVRNARKEGGRERKEVTDPVVGGEKAGRSLVLKNRVVADTDWERILAVDLD